MNTLTPVEPFNDLYYINCFYSCLFPVLSYLGKDFKHLLVNTIYSYEISQLNDKKIFSTDIGRIEELTTLLKQLGVHITRKKRVGSIFSSIEAAINNEKPVIIFVDPYYLPYRKDTYLKWHSYHAVLIYGYDNKNQQFHIIDQTNFLRLDYAKRKVAYHELIAAYEEVEEAIHTSFKNGDTNIRLHYLKEIGIYYEFENKGSSILLYKSYAQQYSIKIQANLDSIYKGLNLIKGSLFTIDPTESVHFINEIINIKRAEKYTVEKILSETKRYQMINTVDNIIRLWQNIKNLQLKALGGNLYELKYESKIEQKKKQLYELETEWYWELSHLVV